MAREGIGRKIMPGPHQISGSVSVPEAELGWRFSRSSGPGGQGVNTTDSRVELSFDLAPNVLPAVFTLNGTVW